MRKEDLIGISFLVLFVTACVLGVVTKSRADARDRALCVELGGVPFPSNGHMKSCVMLCDR